MGGSPGTSAASPDASLHAEPIRTMIVDDHALFRRGLEMVLDEEPDIELVGQASDGTEAGVVTSGSFGPTVNGPVAMGYVKKAFSTAGKEVQVLAEGSRAKATVAELPLWKRNDSLPNV